ncbi:recombinase family protein [Paenibacillus polymyxa]|uniref:recombinase family protein n=1 Tax=Paenibacillus polymyxa TaxID=1406 RepID=UPI00234A81B2|nr:recombinase family protein [Paenibacillus polymyxa]WCM61377.1 recombinase family protein [Paenibacillus polymyxa]
MSKSLKVAIYTRVSTEEQAREGYSLKSQEELLVQYAKDRGYTVYAVYSDEGYSGKNYNRPDIQRLLRHLSEGKFQAILVKSVDRLSRKVSDIGKLLDDILKPRGCSLLVSDNELDSSTTIGTVFINMLGNFAQYERSMIIDRVKAGMKKRAEMGFWNGGIILGYDILNKRLVVNINEANIVREIFNLRTEGKGYKAIATILNSKGFRTKKQGLFSITAIKTILENPAYIGKCRWGRRSDWGIKRHSGITESYVLADGHHEAIITDEIWAKVQAVENVSKDSLAKSRSFRGTFVLSGLLRCPECGGGTCMAKRQKRDGSGYHLYYICQAYQSKGLEACHTNLISKELVESKVLERITELVNNESIIGEVLGKIQAKRLEERASLESLIYSVSTNLQKKQVYSEKLDKDYFEGAISAVSYDELVTKIRIQISSLKESLYNLEKQQEEYDYRGIMSKQEVIDALRNFNIVYAKANFEQKKALMKAVIRKVEMEANRKDIKRISFWFESNNK